MKVFYLYSVSVILLLSGSSRSSGQFLEEVYRYDPAPGQHINTSSAGDLSAAYSILGPEPGLVSLGCFGGSLVARFDEPVINHPDHPYGIDFILFGNAIPGWSEPGIVYVMKDEDGNGKPDDTWYQLAGSDYFFSTTLRNYNVTYFSPKPGESGVPWKDNLGSSGTIERNALHTQPYYPSPALFPDTNPDSFTLAGTRVDLVVEEPDRGPVTTRPKRFGYADNLPGSFANAGKDSPLPDNPYTGLLEGIGGDGMDISWAVDSNGAYVDLDTIHFIKIQTGVQMNAGFLGDISTELSGGLRVLSDPGVSGEDRLVIVGGLPPRITPGSYQLEAHVFIGGRIHNDLPVVWELESGEGMISQLGLLQVSGEGDLIIKVSMQSDPAIYDRITCRVTAPLNSGPSHEVIELHPFPNPFHDHLMISGTPGEKIQVFATDGNVLNVYHLESNVLEVNTTSWPSGLYFLSVNGSGSKRFYKLIRY